MLMSVHLVLITVLTTARIHMDLTPAAAKQDTLWMKMDSLAMV